MHQAQPAHLLVGDTLERVPEKEEADEDARDRLEKGAAALA